jgi:hypothetical protein
MVIAQVIITAEVAVFIRDYQWSGTVLLKRILVIFTSVLSLLLVRVGMAQVSVIDASVDFIDYIHRDTTSVLVLLSEVSLKMSVVVEAICLPILVILSISLIIRMIPAENVNKEIHHLVYGVQYIFADALGSIVRDSGLQKLVALTGLLNISFITDHADVGGAYSAMNIYVHGIYMAWIDIVVGAVVPSGEWSSSKEMDVIAAISLSLLLQMLTSIIPGLSNLQGYIEWRVAIVIADTMNHAIISRLEVIFLSSLLLALLTTAKKYTFTASTHVSIMTTIVDVFTIVWITTTSSYVLDTLVILAATDIITVSVIAITAFGTIYTYVSNNLSVRNF